MTSNPTNIDDAFRMFKQFAERRGLGKPSKILTRDYCEPPWSQTGIGAQWDIEGQEPIRTAIICSHDDVGEIKHRLKEWAES